MLLNEFKELMIKADDKVVKADVKCYYCGKITKDALHFYPKDALQDVINEFHFEQQHSFHCKTCQNVVKVGFRDLRNTKITDKCLKDLAADISPILYNDSYQIWENHEQTILVNPNKIEEGNRYSVGYYEFTDFYYKKDALPEKNIFSKGSSIEVQWEYQMAFIDAICPRRIGRIVKVNGNPKLLNKTIEVRLNRLYREYVEVEIKESPQS